MTDTTPSEPAKPARKAKGWKANILTLPQRSPMPETKWKVIDSAPRDGSVVRGRHKFVPVSGSQDAVRETYYDLPARAWLTLTANGWTPWQPKHWKR